MVVKATGPNLDITRALSDPVRLRILESLWEGPKTARALAGAVGMIPNRLYYHLRALEAAGVVKVVDAEATARGAERVYGATTLGYGNEMPGSGPERVALFRAMFMASAEELALAVEHGSFHSASRGYLRTTPEAMAELLETLGAAFGKARDSAGGAGARNYRFAYTTYELPGRDGEQARAADVTRDDR